MTKRKITDKKRKNTDGLKPPWKKGDPSPNPNGRPPIPEDEKRFRNINKDLLKALVSSGKYEESINTVVGIQTRQGKHEVLKFLYESVNGKPVQAIGTINDQPIEIRFVD